MTGEDLRLTHANQQRTQWLMGVGLPAQVADFTVPEGYELLECQEDGARVLALTHPATTSLVYQVRIAGADGARTLTPWRTHQPMHTAATGLSTAVLRDVLRNHDVVISPEAQGFDNLRFWQSRVAEAVHWGLGVSVTTIDEGEVMEATPLQIFSTDIWGTGRYSIRINGWSK
ncbi:hypothetical protein [Ferrimonas marina]|uniref:Uncharacterized protein n=1 Tax=Ferrimonas marina TaxID=299255 RepID=A0A1M5TUY0_9GAMM|nr:hypothetical protein [Ferrimonas marina]SHH54440.1 hypothetical protein SAMN02745129_2284 [Ferrimonas marina]